MDNNYLLISIIFISLAVVFFTYWMWKVKRQVDLEIRFDNEVRHMERRIINIDNYLETLDVMDDINALFERWLKEKRINDEMIKTNYIRLINTRKRIQDRYFHQLINGK